MSIPDAPILVVEDIRDVLELLETTLRLKRYAVVTAAGGKEVLEKIAQQRPAMIITDILMPKMDGYALVHNIRKNPLASQMPIVFISATCITPEDKKFALSLGGVRFIEKPVDTEEFLLTVAEVLTQGISTQPRPLNDEVFYRGYGERLESTLGYKTLRL
ncbi:MAG TPA: response regulator [Levilinea sp.]|nr:response regulator [Levilinea sp.]